METKLTLRLDENAINRAKSYSKYKHISLSSLVEKFFITLDNEQFSKTTSKESISPSVKEISGIFDMDYDYDLKSHKKVRLIKKYL